MTVVGGGAADPVDGVEGGVVASGELGLPVAARSTSQAPPEASNPEPATTHRVADTQKAPFSAPDPVTL